VLWVAVATEATAVQRERWDGSGVGVGGVRVFV
jgi:hypothetical protein